MIREQQGLVVSTSQLDGASLCAILELRGYISGWVCPGLHMLSYIRSVRPELVIYDARETWCAAINVITRIREVSPECRIVVIRNNADWVEYFEAVDAGAADLLSKPYNAGTVLNSVSLLWG